VGTAGSELFEMLLLGDDILDIDRFRARYSADLLVCERALVGIRGASSSNVTGSPKKHDRWFGSDEVVVGDDSTDEVSGEVYGVPTLEGAVESELLLILRPSELVLELGEDRPLGKISGAL